MNSNSSRTIVALFVVTALFCGCSKSARQARSLDQADRYFNAGEFEKAKIEYMNVLRLGGQNVTAYQQLGFIWSEQGAPIRAIPFLFKVRELAPQNSAARSKLARELMAVGQSVEARKEAIAILKQDPANSDAIFILADSSNDEKEIADAEQELEKFPQKNTAAFHLAKASLALKKQDVGGAADEAQQALAAEPKSARAHLVIGLLHLLRKNPSSASQEFKTAAELAPVRSEERIKYAEFQAANGDVKGAKDFLQQITAKAPDYLPAWRDLAQIAVTEKKFDDALSLLENVFSRDPDNPDSRLLQATVWLQKGDSAKGIAILDKLSAVSPNNPMLKYQLARAYILSKNPAQASLALEQAIAAKPDYAEAILMLAELNVRAGKPKPVVAALEDLRKKRPDLEMARVLLATAYQLLGRPDDAVSVFREQLKLTPNSIGDHLLLGVILRQEKKSDEARLEFEKAAELAPDNWRAINELVDLDLAEKKIDAALQRVQQYVQQRPNDAGGHYMLGKIGAAQKDWSNAESELHKAIDLAPDFGAAYNALVSVYVAQKKLPEAVAQLENELKKSPEDPRIVMTLGLLYEQTKDYSKAADAYEKLLTLTPDSVVGLNNLAYLYVDRLNRLDRASELAQKARSLQPDDPSVADSLGWVLYKRGDYEQALGLFQESATKQQESPTIQFHLGMAAQMMGQADTARAAFEKALSLKGDFPEKEEAQRRLAALHSGATNPAEPELSDIVGLKRHAEELEKSGKPAEAADIYEQAFRLNPRLTSMAVKLAQLYGGSLQKPEKAMEYARKARAMAPTDVDVAAVLGHVAIESGNFAWGYSLLQEVLRQRRDDPALLYDLAMATYALGKVQEARQGMQRVVDLAANPQQTANAKQFLQLTALDRPSSQAVAAQSEIEAVLKTQPDDVPALMARAAVEQQQNNLPAAKNTYITVLKKYPDFAPAQRNLAIVSVVDPGEMSKAYDLAMKARRTLPDDPDLARVLAEISFQRKDYAYAIQLFEQSERNQPLSAKDLYYLGLAQMQARQQGKGRETLQRAIAAGLQEPFAQEAKKRLVREPPK